MLPSDGKGGSTSLPRYLAIPSTVRDVTLDVSLFLEGYY